MCYLTANAVLHSTILKLTQIHLRPDVELVVNIRNDVVHLPTGNAESLRLEPGQKNRRNMLSSTIQNLLPVEIQALGNLEFNFQRSPKSKRHHPSSQVSGTQKIHVQKRCPSPGTRVIAERPKLSDAYQSQPWSSFLTKRIPRNTINIYIYTYKWSMPRICVNIVVFSQPKPQNLQKPVGLGLDNSCSMLQWIWSNGFI